MANSFQTYSGDSKAQALAPLKVMLFDLDRAGATVTRQVLEQAGKPDCVYHSQERDALSVHLNRPFDVILVDVTAETSDRCYGLITELRNPGRFLHQPRIVALLGQSYRKMLQDVIAAGADTAWVKPLAPSMVREKLLEIRNADIPYVAVEDYLGPDRRRVPSDLAYDGQERRHLDGDSSGDGNGI